MGAILIWSLNYLVALIFLEMPLLTPLTQHGRWLFFCPRQVSRNSHLFKGTFGRFAMGISVAFPYLTHSCHISAELAGGQLWFT